MNILGINAYHGDVAAALVRDGELVAAVEEERFRRIKHCAGFPSRAIAACLEIGAVAPEEIDHVAVSRDPKANRLRRLWFALGHRPGRGLVRDRLRNRARVRDLRVEVARSLGREVEELRAAMHWVEHHPAHLASAFFVSPFEEAAVSSIDGFGDFASTSFAKGRGTRLEVLDRIFFPHSLGLLYLAITQFLGFPSYGDEYKVMGLAPYGVPDFTRALRRLVHPRAGGKFELDLSYFRHWSEGVAMTWEDGEPRIDPVYTPELERLLGPARGRDEPIEPRHTAIAASLQVVFEEVVFEALNALYERTRLPRLCLAGGCAMNSVANGKIRQKTPFREVFIQPAAGDNGTALGAAFHVWNQTLRGERRFVMEHAYWGPAYDGPALRASLEVRTAELTARSCRPERIESDSELVRWTASRIAEGKIVGWFQGRMEWGARALGNRSILADPRRADMRDVLNAKIKLREKFRPFAPAILEEALDEYFEGAAVDPFMVQVYPVRPDKRSVIPAVTHADGSGRIQTVRRATNPLFWGLIEAFRALTGVPVLLNTSFNENEPIVCRPEEAMDCFLRTDMDVLVLGHHVMEKGGAEARDEADRARAYSTPR